LEKSRNCVQEGSEAVVDLKLVNGSIFFRRKILEGGIAVDNGYIVKVGKEPNLPEADLTLDCTDCFILPGLIDVHVHLRDLKLSYKEDFFTGTAAAAKGGFTTVLDMPNTIPPTNTPENLKLKAYEARGRAVVEVGFLAGLPPTEKDAEELVKLGVFGFKVYMDNKEVKTDISSGSKKLKQLLNIAKKHGLRVAFHAELTSGDYWDINSFLTVHNEECEVKAVETCIRLAKLTGAKVHVCHVSIFKAAEKIIKAKREGVNVTFEVTPHHLFLTEDDLKKLGSIAKTLPPLRKPENARQLYRLVRGGLVDIIASDHAPHTTQEKKESFKEAPPGIPGLETTLPLLFTEVIKGNLPLHLLVRLLAQNPAVIYGFKKRGYIEEGGRANLTVVKKVRWRVNPEDFTSKARYSPFKGVEVLAKPWFTVVSGRVVLTKGELTCKPGEGAILLRKNLR